MNSFTYIILYKNTKTRYGKKYYVLSDLCRITIRCIDTEMSLTISHYTT